MRDNKYTINAADLIPLGSFLVNEAGQKVRSRIFNAQGVPTEIIGNCDIHVPYSDICALYERAARYIGDPLFGVRCGSLYWGLEQLGPLGKYGLQAPTLGHCLQRLITALHLYEGGTNSSLVRHGDMATFSYSMPFERPLGWEHYMGSILSLMTQVGCYFAGSDWRPHRIGINRSRNQFTHFLEDFHEIPIDCDEPALCIKFPASDLDIPNSTGTSVRNPLTLSDVVHLLNTSPPDSMIELVTGIVRMRLLGGLTDIEGAAQHLRLGVRTLQRRISDEGKSYRNIVSEARCRRAVDLLIETEIPITEIALSLGYKYSNDFSRAVRLYFGQTPSEIRHVKLLKVAA